MSTALAPEELEILSRTSRNGRYAVGPDSPSAFRTLRTLAKEGFMTDHGMTAYTAMHYFTITQKGRDALKAWRDSLPKHKKPTRGHLRYMQFLRSPYSISFGEWLKITPHTP